MSTIEFERFADVIDANLEHLHRERWNQRAAELHAEIASPIDGVSPEEAAQALCDHYANRFRPETSREALLEQAAINHAAGHTGHI